MPAPPAPLLAVSRGVWLILRLTLPEFRLVPAGTGVQGGFCLGCSHPVRELLGQMGRWGQLSSVLTSGGCDSNQTQFNPFLPSQGNQQVCEKLFPGFGLKQGWFPFIFPLFLPLLVQWRSRSWVKQLISGKDLICGGCSINSRVCLQRGGTEAGGYGFLSV